MDWQKIAVQAVLAMGECCGCSITGSPEDYLREHLTADEIKALQNAVAAVERGEA